MNNNKGTNGLGIALVVVFFVIFIGTAVVMGITVLNQNLGPKLVAFVPFGMGLFGLIMLAFMLKKMMQTKGHTDAAKYGKSTIARIQHLRMEKETRSSGVNSRYYHDEMVYYVDFEYTQDDGNRAVGTDTVTEAEYNVLHGQFQLPILVHKNIAVIDHTKLYDLYGMGK